MYLLNYLFPEKISKILIDHTLDKKSLNIPGGVNQSSLLQYAVLHNNYKLIYFLLINEVDTNYTNIKNKDVFYIIYKYDLVLSYLLFKHFNIKDKRLRKGKRILLIYNRNVNTDLLYINKYTILVYSIFYPEKVKRSSYFLYINILYSLEIFDKIDFLSILYFLVFIYLILHKEKIKQKNENLIIDLILNDNYNLDKYCYICQKYKLSHCSYCDRCVEDKHHHCIFLHNCVLKKDLLPFYFYVSIYLLKIIYLIYKEKNLLKQIEYVMIALILLIK